MTRIAKLAVVLGLAATAAACGPAIVADPSGRLIHTGLAGDGDCVSRTVSGYDREIGYEVPVTQRFCGGRTVIAQ